MPGRPTAASTSRWPRSARSPTGPARSPPCRSGSATGSGSPAWESEYQAQQAERQRLADDLSTAQNRLSTGWRPDKGTGKHTRATRAPALVPAVHRRQEDLEAHVVDVPQPPLRFQLPKLGELPGATLLRAEDVAVGGRLAGAERLLLCSGDRLVVAGLLASRDTSRPVHELSIGQQRRLDLAVLLAARPHVVLLDEPTNHLSIALVDELTEALTTTPAAVVLATHDRRLLQDTAGWPRVRLYPAVEVAHSDRQGTS